MWLIKPKFHYDNFYQNLSAGKVADTYHKKKLPTQTVTNHEVSAKVADTNHLDINHLDVSRCLWKSPWQVCDKSVCVALMELRPLQCTGKVHDKVCGHKSWKMALWFVLQTFMICVCSGLCCGLCHKVGVMKFWLNRHTAMFYISCMHCVLYPTVHGHAVSAVVWLK